MPLLRRADPLDAVAPRRSTSGAVTGPYRTGLLVVKIQSFLKVRKFRNQAGKKRPVNSVGVIGPKVGVFSEINRFTRKIGQ